MTVEQLSATGAVTYSQCPRKFYWQRVERWQRSGATEVNAMSLGSMTHWLIEQGLSYALENDACKPKHFSMTAITHAMREIDTYIASNYESDISQGRAYEEQVPYARQMALNLFMWMEAEGFFERYEVISMEKEFEAGSYRCRPDIVVRDMIVDVYGVFDFKTSTNLNQEVMNSDWQMRMMAIVLEEALRKPMAFGGHIRIKKIKDTKRAKPPYVELKEMSFDEKRLDIARKEIHDFMWRIEQDVVWLPNPHWTCASSCGYYDACEAKTAGQDWEYVLGTTHERKVNE